MTIFKSIDEPWEKIEDVDIEIVSELIRIGHNHELIKSIRHYRSLNDDYYKVLKKELPVVAPFGTFSYRSKNHLIAISGYLYLDIDKLVDMNEAISKKAEIIEKYGDKISMLCISSSGAGLTMFIKIDRSYSIEELSSVYSYAKTLFPDLIFDSKVGTDGDIARGCFLSHDPDVFVNRNSILHIPKDIPHIPPKLSNNNKVKDSTLNLTLFNECPIDEVLANTVIKTSYKMKNDVVDNVDREFLVITWPKVIADGEGKKHAMYPGMIFKYLRLNPVNGTKYVYSFMKHINDTHGKPPMEEAELKRIVLACAENYSEDVSIKTRRKGLSFNDVRLTKKEKNTIANQINGIKKKIINVNTINEIRNDLIEKGIKPTQTLIAKMTGISRQTINKHWSLASAEHELTDKLNLVNTIYKNRVVKFTKDNCSTLPVNDCNDINNTILKDSTLNLTLPKLPEVIKARIRIKRENTARGKKAAATRKKNRDIRTRKALAMLRERFGISHENTLKHQAMTALNTLNQVQELNDNTVANGGVLDSQNQDETSNECTSLSENTAALNEPLNKPDWWQSLEYYESAYGEDGKEMYEGQFSMIERLDPFFR